MSTPELEPNTPAQEAAHLKNEARAAEEATWPIFRVEIAGDEVAWNARPNPTYWQANPDPKTADAEPWIPLPQEELPEHAKVVDGQVVMVAYAMVDCHAKTEEQAKMLALRDNPDYHTILSVTNLSDLDVSTE